ncbi:MAG: DUF4156 domain-containing protein [Rhodanobacteraceae bacterium]
MTRNLVPICLIAALSACSWGIKLDSGGEKVRTAWNGRVEGCRNIGKVTVSVLDRIGPIDRSGMAVRDELEVMARNEAAGMGADTVAPIGQPQDGAQSWNAYACGAQGINPARAKPVPDDKAQTFPIKH